MRPGGLSLEGVSVVFNRHTPNEQTALRNLSLSLEPSEYVTVIGPNGAGKSTLLNVIAGAVPATSGRVALDRNDITKRAEHARSALVARVMQDPRQNTCEDLTIKENLAVAERRGRSRSPFAFGTSERRMTRSLELLGQSGRGLERRLSEMAGRLSGGQRQVLAMVMAVSNPPAVLMLDEHTSALDPEMAQSVMRLTDEVVRAGNITTIMVTHNMRQALEYGDRILIMSQGKVVDDIGLEVKRELDEPGLIARFRAVVGEDITDRLVA